MIDERVLYGYLYNTQTMSFFRFVQSSNSAIVQTFGRYSKTVGPGLRLFVPFVQKMTPISHRLQQNTFKFKVKTSDDAFTTLGLAVQYKIEPKNAEKAFFSLNDPISQMDSYIENVVRSKVPTMTLDRLFKSQNDICDEVGKIIGPKMAEHGYTIESTLVTEVDPPKEIKDAMNQINATSRLKEAAKNEADAHYIKEVRQAEADRDRKRLQGEGIALQRKAIMEGYQTGIKDMSKQLSLDPKEIIQLVMNTQHLDTLETIGKSANTKTLFLNHDPKGANHLRDAFIQAGVV